MKQEILMMGSVPKDYTKLLEERYNLHKLWQEEDPEFRLNEIKDKVTGILSISGIKVSDNLINALPNLEIIANYGVGYDNINIEAAKAKGIVVTNTPDVVTADTADMAVALTLAVLRRIVEADIYVRSGLWGKRGNMPLGRSLSGKKIGIIGMGRIGQAIAHRLEGFGTEIIYNSRTKKEELSYGYIPNLDVMLKEVDVAIISCNYSEETHELISAKEMKALGKSGFLINIARGNIINEQDLIDALEGGVIAGAGLDVFANEPDVPSAFSRLDNVVLQPHRGTATIEARDAMAKLVCDNLDMYFKKAKVLTQVI